MYRDIFESNGQELIKFRLDTLKEELRSLNIPTRPELQAEVASRLNRILSLGVGVTPLVPIPGEAPAVVGHVSTNLEILNNDGTGIVQHLTGLEQEAARLFNLSASTQNALRQQVREQVFLTTRKKYLETFINDAQLETSTASFDFGVGMATLPFVKETTVVPSKVEFGTASDGDLESTSSLANLLDGKSETSMVWSGEQVEFLITFAVPSIINRMRIELDDYQGLNIVMFTASPDGILREDLLAEILPESRSLDGSSNKFSGDVVIDFDPRHVKQMRLVIADRVGDARISLRALAFYARQYATVGLLTSRSIDTLDLGFVNFSTVERSAEELTSITHQTSYDGVHYTSVTPGTQFDLGGKPFWYRSYLERLDSNFDLRAAPVAVPGQDPGAATYYKVSNVLAVDVGNNILERSISIDLYAKPNDDGSRPIVLRESVLPGTLTVYQGTALLGPAEYQYVNNAISFSGNDDRSGILIRYQTSSFA